MIVYELTHLFHRINGSIVLEPISLGLFSSLDRIKEAMQYYFSKPGFCDNPEGFSIRQREVNGTIANFEIFEAIAYFHTDDYEYEYSSELGLWGKEALSTEAMDLFVQNNRHLFNIQDLIAEKIVNRRILDKNEWAEGFSISE